MTADRDLLWADMVQFDPPHADRVWEGDLADPDTPAWYGHLGDLIHRARGPAETDELLDEPIVVDNMRRAGLGATIRALPRRRRVRTVGRMVAMKATAAATTAGMVGVAAAATTGIVATVAATVVVPAINDRVLPVIKHHVLPAEVTFDADGADPLAAEDAEHTPGCPTDSVPCTLPGGPVVIDVPAPSPDETATAAPEITEATDDTAAAPDADVAVDATPAETAPAVVDPAPVDPAPVDPARVAPAPVDPAPADPAPAAVPPADPAPAVPPPVETPVDIPGRARAEQASGGRAGPHTEPPTPPSVQDDSPAVPPGT